MSLEYAESIMKHLNSLTIVEWFKHAAAYDRVRKQAQNAINNHFGTGWMFNERL